MDGGSTGIVGVDTLVAWCVGVGAVAGVLALGWRVLRRTRALLRMVDAFADDWHGTDDRPGVPGHPGVMKRLGGIEQRLTGVEAHVGQLLLEAPGVEVQSRVRSVS